MYFYEPPGSLTIFLTVFSTFQWSETGRSQVNRASGPLEEIIEKKSWKRMDVYKSPLLILQIGVGLCCVSTGIEGHG